MNKSEDKLSKYSLKIGDYVELRSMGNQEVKVYVTNPQNVVEEITVNMNQGDILSGQISINMMNSKPLLVYYSPEGLKRAVEVDLTKFKIKK